MSTDTLLTRAEVAVMLVVGEKWVERKAVAGEIESVKIGHYRRFRPEAIEKYLAEHTTSSVAVASPPASVRILRAGDR